MDQHALALIAVTAFCLAVGLVGGLAGRAEKMARIAKAREIDALRIQRETAQALARIVAARSQASKSGKKIPDSAWAAWARITVDLSVDVQPTPLVIRLEEENRKDLEGVRRRFPVTAGRH